MSDLDTLHIDMERGIAEAIRSFERASGCVVADIRIDRYEGAEFCIGATLAVSQEPAK